MGDKYRLHFHAVNKAFNFLAPAAEAKKEEKEEEAEESDDDMGFSK